MNRTLKVATAAFLLAVAGTPAAFAPASATIVKDFEFDVDGVLPSADPQIVHENNTGHLESAIYTVSGGLLQQRSFAVNGNASYLYPNLSVTGGNVDPNESFTMEARVRILQIEGDTGAFFQAFDGVSRYRFSFNENGLSLLTNNPSLFYQIDFDTSDFHTYRLDSLGSAGAFDFYIDNTLTYSGHGYASTGNNGFDFGDGITAPGAGADADWDFIRFSQPASVAAVPEPAPLALLALGLAGIGVARRRRAG